MFQERSPSELQDILDQFEVPMFAVERAHGAAPWRVVAFNKAWEHCTGQDRAIISGKPVDQVFPPRQAEWLSARFDDCATAAGPTHYSEERRVAGRTIEFDTSLQWAELPKGAQRVIGTTLAVQKPVAPRERSAMAEIRDYAVEADYHVSRMLAFIQAEAAQAGSGQEAMAGICRSVSSLLTDIRRAAEAQDCLRHGQSPWAAAPVIGAEDEGHGAMQSIGRQVLRV